MSISLELITSEGKLLEEQVKELYANTESGEIGILENHTDLKTKLVPSPVRLTKADGSKDVVAVLGGVLEVGGNKITILSKFAQMADDINEVEAQEAAKKAEADLRMHDPKQRGDRELLLAEYNLQREMIRMKAVQMRKQFN